MQQKKSYWGVLEIITCNMLQTMTRCHHCHWPKMMLQRN